MPHYDSMRTLDNVPAAVLQQIEHFFAHYKDLEPESSSSCSLDGRRRGARGGDAQRGTFNESLSGSRPA